MTATKLCTKCGLDLPLTDFHKKPRSWCRKCISRDNVARQAAQPEKATARTNAWRAANPGRASQISRDWQLRHPEQFRQMVWRRKYNTDVAALWEAQQGRCASCKGQMLRDGRQKASMCVDHDRSCCPGQKSCGQCVRGLIHWKCNLVLGYAGDDPQVLQSAITYLERWKTKQA